MSPDAAVPASQSDSLLAIQKQAISRVSSPLNNDGELSDVSDRRAIETGLGVLPPIAFARSRANGTGRAAADRRESSIVDRARRQRANISRRLARDYGETGSLLMAAEYFDAAEPYISTRRRSSQGRCAGRTPRARPHGQGTTRPSHRLLRACACHPSR